jgi:hypothetical protein
MVAPTPDQLLDELAIDRLLRRYADVCTRRAWPELHDLFVPDATVVLDLRDRELVIDGPGALGEFIGGSLEQFDFFQFAIRNTVVEVGIDDDPDAASGRMWMSEFRHAAASTTGGHAGTEGWSTIFGLYQDRYRRSGDGWRIERRRYQSIARPSEGAVFAVDVLAPGEI